MLDCYIMFTLVLKSIILVKECRVGKLSLVRANDLHVINYYMLHKKNMIAYYHLAFINLQASIGLMHLPVTFN